MIAKTRILVIGSDPELRQVLEENLNDESYEVVSTQRTGYALKDVLYRERPDFIIQDVVMPSLDGIGTCLQLRQWTQIPIMLLSSWGAGEGMVRGLNLCSETYLTEPFGTDELKARIRETMARNIAISDPMKSHTS